MVGFESEHYDLKANELITVSEEWGFEKEKKAIDPNWKLFSIKVVS
jgi:predicted lipid-binding transport protein (Tim44 family)